MPYSSFPHRVLSTCRLLAFLWVGCASQQAVQPPPVTEPATPPATPPQACERGAPEAALPDLGHAELLAELGTGLDAYQVTGGAWLDEQPLLLNEAFDFAVAMSLQDIGPAIAAGKRKQANEAKVERLAGQSLDAALLKRLAQLHACGIHVFAVLWGDAEASSLQVVIDVYERAQDRHEHVDHAVLEHPARPLAEDRGWTPQALGEAFERALDARLATSD